MLNWYWQMSLIKSLMNEWIFESGTKKYTFCGTIFGWNFEKCLKILLRRTFNKIKITYYQMKLEAVWGLILDIYLFNILHTAIVSLPNSDLHNYWSNVLTTNMLILSDRGTFLWPQPGFHGLKSYLKIEESGGAITKMPCPILDKWIWLSLCFHSKANNTTTDHISCRYSSQLNIFCKKNYNLIKK